MSKDSFDGLIETMNIAEKALQTIDKEYGPLVGMNPHIQVARAIYVNSLMLANIALWTGQRH